MYAHVTRRWHGLEQLSGIERISISIGEYLNERPAAKALQGHYHRLVGTNWVYHLVKNVLTVEGLEDVAAVAPPRGVLLCSNHRSFFDQYILSTLLVREAGWARELYFPVRANFFYDTLPGLAMNLLIGGGAMYPPIFRDRARSSEFTRKERAARDPTPTSSSPPSRASARSP